MALFRTKLIRGTALGLLLTTASVSLAQSPATAAPQQQVAKVSIANFGKVDDHLYRGAQPSGTQYKELAAMGIKTVVDLRDDFERNEQKLVEAAGMTYRRIPMNASRNPTEDEIETFLSLVNDSTTSPVYIHCREGRHRTGVMAAVYRLAKDSWTADEAYSEMKQYRFKSTLHFLFGHENLKDFVYDYHAELQKAAAASQSRTSGG